MNPPNTTEQLLEISGQLDINDYICDVPVQLDTKTLLPPEASIASQLPRDIAAPDQIRKDLESWVTQKREGARSGIATTVVVFFGISLLAEFTLIAVGAIYQQANVALIKDTLPLLVNSLTPIVSLALAFYFKEK